MSSLPLRTVVGERPLEEVILERDFAALLASQGALFFRIGKGLSASSESWSKRDFFLLANEAEDLETFLDDYGAKSNRAYCLTRELIASVRWHALAAIRACHLEGRFDSYRLPDALSSEQLKDARESFAELRRFGQQTIASLIRRVLEELMRLGVPWSELPTGAEHTKEDAIRRRLPHNVGQEEPVDENQRIAEVAAKYLAASDVLVNLGIRRIADPVERRGRLAAICSESQARVYEATVHNLQSTYDTHVKNTVVEGRDDRLPRLRGHLSAALHLLEAATFLTHFVERHEVGVRADAAERRIGHLVDRARVEELILNHLLFWANELMQLGRPLAEELLPAYTNMQELRVELPDTVKLHARPAALIVNIVIQHGTPVELELEGHRCNAGSILELLVAVGSHPDARTFVFRGDVHPLRDISLLFHHGLAEDGIDRLPPALHYLKT